MQATVSQEKCLELISVLEILRWGHRVSGELLGGQGPKTSIRVLVLDLIHTRVHMECLANFL